MSHPVSGHVAIFSDPNGVPLQEGKTLHMELAPGDLANRIITVGSAGRAELIAKNFDADKPVKVFKSGRGFTTFSGFYQGVYCSIVAIGMGPSMMDFFVRESRAIAEGPMAMIRYGTCGGLSELAVPGKIAVAAGGSGYVVRNPDAFANLYNGQESEEKTAKPYLFFDVCPSDAELTALVTQTLSAELGSDSYVEGVNITADSFYSSQGRQDSRFEDRNATMVQDIVHHYPRAMSMEMESFMLLHLAKTSRVPIKATAAAIVLANRLSSMVLEGDVLKHTEEVGGRAVLHAVAHVQL